VPGPRAGERSLLFGLLFRRLKRGIRRRLLIECHAFFMIRKLTSSPCPTDSDHRTLRRETRLERIEQRSTRIDNILSSLERVLGERVSREGLIGLGDVHGRHVELGGALDGDDVQEIDYKSIGKVKRTQRKPILPTSWCPRGDRLGI